MRMRHAAVVAGLALGLMSGAAKAGTLEYNILVPFNDGNAITGTIDTDYKAGVLSKSDIFSYNLFYAGFNFSSSDPNAATEIDGTSLVAVGNQLNFVFDNSGSDFLISQGNPIIEFVAGPFSDLSFYEGNSISSYSEMDVAPGTVLTIGLSEGSVMSPVPLPASAPMFGAALIALGAIGYGLKRKGKAAA